MPTRLRRWLREYLEVLYWCVLFGVLDDMTKEPARGGETRG